MRVVLQRVRYGRVRVDDRITGEIGPGLVLLVGLGQGDTASVLQSAAEKILNLRIFPDDRGRFHLSLRDHGGGVLLVPQFTLFADTSKGRRPEFFGALEPAKAAPLFAECVAVFRSFSGLAVEAGVFGAHMHVELENDGPVTLWLEFH